MGTSVDLTSLTPASAPSAPAVVGVKRSSPTLPGGGQQQQAPAHKHTESDSSAFKKNLATYTEAAKDTKAPAAGPAQLDGQTISLLQQAEGEPPAFSYEAQAAQTEARRKTYTEESAARDKARREGVQAVEEHLAKQSHTQHKTAVEVAARVLEGNPTALNEALAQQALAAYAASLAANTSSAPSELSLSA